jgi:hypothetical protein
LVVSIVKQPSLGGLVIVERARSAEIDRKLLKIGQNRYRQIRRPPIPSKLICRRDPRFDVYVGPFYFHKKLFLFIQTEAIIGIDLLSFDLNLIFFGSSLFSVGS